MTLADGSTRLLRRTSRDPSPLPAIVEAVRGVRGSGDCALRASFFEFQHKVTLLETAFEMVKRHLMAGDLVTYRFLGHDLPFTNQSPYLGSAVFGPWLPERIAARVVADQALTFVPRTRLRRRRLPYAVPDSLEELMALRYEDFDLGMAVASSTISLTRNSQLRPADHRAHLRRVLEGAIAVYDLVRCVLEDERPDVVYVYNGRFAFERAVRRACEAVGVPCFMYEWGSTFERFYLRPFAPHDRRRVQEEVRANWCAVQHDHCARDVASGWFSERRQGQPKDWPSFTALQERGRLPKQLRGGRVIAYFSSSDDEFVAIGDEYRWHGWKDQFEAVRDLIRIVDACGDMQLVVRVHPHLVHKHPLERERWMAFQGSSPALTVIPPESDVDTYALIDAADVVVTAGSAVGAEAAFWNRPSVLVGPSEYDELGIVHRPFNAAQLARMLQDPTLPVGREAALGYGYHRATFGEPYTVYQPTGFHQGKFDGVDLRSRLWKALAEGRRQARRAIHGVERWRARSSYPHTLIRRAH